MAPPRRSSNPQVRTRRSVTERTERNRRKGRLEGPNWAILPPKFKGETMKARRLGRKSTPQVTEDAKLDESSRHHALGRTRVADGGRVQKAEATADRAELKRLRAENRALRQEIEFLKHVTPALKKRGK